VYTFKTASGAEYTVHNGRIAREQGRTPIFGSDDDLAAAGVPDGSTVVARSFKWVVEPEVGKRAGYLLDGATIPVFTSRVESIEGRDDA
jgi:hypothetical protein